MHIQSRWFLNSLRVILSGIFAMGLCLSPGSKAGEVQAWPWPILPVVTITVTAPAVFSDLPSGVGAYIAGDSICPSGPFAYMGCTLREAVDEANIMAAGLVPPAFVMVNFAPSIPIELFFGPILVQSNVVIAGIPGAEPLIMVSPILPTPPVPFPPAVPPFDIFQLNGNNSEVFGTFIINIASYNADAIEINGNLNLVDYNVLLGNSGAGVRILGPKPTNGTNNVISHNWIGIDPGDSCFGNLFGVVVEVGAATNTIDHNLISCSTNDGILLDSALGQVSTTVIDTNTIGLDSLDSTPKPNGQNGINDIEASGTKANFNIISGNGADGIRLTGSVDANITANYIGTDGTGATAIPNGANGILVEDAADDAGLNNNIKIWSNNLISGNTLNGIEVTGIYMDHVAIFNNTIGLDLAGTAAIPNLGDGVFIHETSFVNVGGLAPVLDRNRISGNTLDGVEIDAASDILVDSNFIGLDATGLVKQSNGRNGVYVHGGLSTNVVIGSLPPYTLLPNQYISGNSESGVKIDSSPGVIIGPKTFIGVASDGTTPLGNAWDGVVIYDVSSTFVHSQVISNNGSAGIYAGVTVKGSSTGVEIRPYAVSSVMAMEIRDNTGPPIDLNDDGHTENDPGDADSGPNTLLNYPVITGFDATHVWGTACNNCNIYLYQALGNPGFDGGGGIFLDWTSATGTSWNTLIPSGWKVSDLTWVAVDAAGNTSEMLPRFLMFQPMIIKP
jgi:hypothetical protein